MPVTKEINQREADGISVTLYAHFDDFNKSEVVDISCRVIDSRNGTDFTISDIAPNEALETFYHPFAVGERVLLTGRV
jgi:hypothetical protein